MKASLRDTLGTLRNTFGAIRNPLGTFRNILGPFRNILRTFQELLKNFQELFRTFLEPFWDLLKKQEICQFVFQGRPSLCLKYSFENVLIFIFLRRQFFFGKEKVYRRYIYMQCKMFVWNLIMQFCISHSTYTPAVTLKFQFVLYISDCI